MNRPAALRACATLLAAITSLALGSDPLAAQTDAPPPAPAAIRVPSVEAVRPLTVYLLPLSITEFASSETQPAVEAQLAASARQALELARTTAELPAGHRFRWNLDVAWSAESCWLRLPPLQRAEFLTALRDGRFEFGAASFNALTGLCRPEELIRLFEPAARFARRHDLPLDSAILRDVPGLTWGTVTAMAQAGIRYGLVAPHASPRLGPFLPHWEHRPFYWLGPDGQSRVLVWVPASVRGPVASTLTLDWLNCLQATLDESPVPLDVAGVACWSLTPNAPPDASLVEFVQNWNRDHVWPRFVIATAREAFQALEQRWASRLPEFRGDWTPFAEGGAASSAYETALNRASSERLAQAETLRALCPPAPAPAADGDNALDFAEAWRQVLLYSDQTWGSAQSVREPDDDTVGERWDAKQSFALEADRRSQDLLDQFLNGPSPPAGETDTNAVEVLNTTSWTRTELIRLSPGLSAAGDRVHDEHQAPVPSQRLTNGELAVLVRDLPPYASRLFRLSPGTPFPPTDPSASASLASLTLDSAPLRVRLDPHNGSILELQLQGVFTNLVDADRNPGLNAYLYQRAHQPERLETATVKTARVLESGPLVASLQLLLEAPGAERLVTEVRVTAGLNALEVFNLIDKRRLRATDYLALEAKESVRFAFPFRFLNGQLRVDLPLAVIQPDRDQLPAACRNWLTAGRWMEVSDRDRGVTWVTLDAPLVELDRPTGTFPLLPDHPAPWLTSVAPSARWFSWVMNNHWNANYRAWQEGPGIFRYVIRPHQGADLVEAARFATRFTQPLLAAPARTPRRLAATPRLELSNPRIVALALNRSHDGQALILRLYGASGQPQATTLRWANPQPKSLHVSGTREHSGAPVEGPIHVPGSGVLTLRAEF